MMNNEKPVFQPEPRPRRLKTNTNKIAQHVAKRITELGFGVYISCSTKSKSRYLEIILSDGRTIIVRISDHPSGKANRWRHRYDIHSAEWRRGSMDYIEFLDTFKQIIGYVRPEAVNIQPGSPQGKEQL